MSRMLLSTSSRHWELNDPRVQEGVDPAPAGTNPIRTRFARPRCCRPIANSLQRGCRQLFGIVPKLSIKTRIVVGVHATLEVLGVGRSIKEVRGHTPGTNPVARCPCSTDLISLAHFASSMARIGATL